MNKIFIHPYETTYVNYKGKEKTRTMLCTTLANHIKLSEVIQKFVDVIDNLEKIERLPISWNTHDDKISGGLKNHLDTLSDLSSEQYNKWSITLNKLGYDNPDDFAIDMLNYKFVLGEDWNSSQNFIERQKRRNFQAEKDYTISLEENVVVLPMVG